MRKKEHGRIKIRKYLDTISMSRYFNTSPPQVVTTTARVVHTSCNNNKTLGNPFDSCTYTNITVKCARYTVVLQ